MNKYSTECALITSHFVAESDTQNVKIRSHVRMDSTQAEKKLLCIQAHTHTYIHIKSIQIKSYHIYMDSNSHSSQVHAKTAMNKLNGTNRT